MRRATFVLGLASSAATLALVALVVYGIGSDRPSSTVEPRRGEAKQAPQTSSIETELNESTGVVPLRSTDSYQKPAVTEALSDAGLVDEDTSRKMVREHTAREVREVYSLLLEHLNLTSEEKEALLSLLIEDRIAGTTTRFSRGKAMNEHERANRIAAIIGSPKLQQFLALERNIRAYAEVQKIGALLQQNSVPLADKQRDGLFEILVVTRDRYPTTLPSDAKLGSIESLEQTINARDEYERHVLELAPSVLSREQARYLFEQYQHLSHERAHALEAQRKQRADHTTEDRPLWYPAW